MDILKRLFGEALPDREALLREINQAENTPDLLLHDRSPYVLVFEYGDMMRGMQHHSMMDSDFMTEAYTEERFFVYTHLKGKFSYPIATNVPVRNASKGRVKGELYLMKPDNFINLDKYRENGVLFRRKKTRILLPGVDEFGVTNRVPAWVYVGTDVWREKITWDHSFYRGGSAFKPAKLLENANRCDLHQHSLFTSEDMVSERTPKSYLFTSSGLTKDE